MCNNDNRMCTEECRAKRYKTEETPCCHACDYEDECSYSCTEEFGKCDCEKLAYKADHSEDNLNTQIF